MLVHIKKICVSLLYYYACYIHINLPLESLYQKTRIKIRCLVLKIKPYRQKKGLCFIIICWDDHVVGINVSNMWPNFFVYTFCKYSLWLLLLNYWKQLFFRLKQTYQVKSLWWLFNHIIMQQVPIIFQGTTKLHRYW